ncbi:glycosyltransferase [Alteromonas macleodii]|uniref:glycosyltransferase n=1 Tax=Alteromonas macleodii TaxID=28108 RepID=UPI0031402D60
MRIAVLSSASAGGAGIAAYRIYEALKSSGQEVDFIDINAIGAVSQEISPPISATNNKITNTHFTVDHASESRDWLVNMLSEYDVINVQWASYLVSLSEILALAKASKKIVFTMHDFYYITGGCHYPAGCYGFAAGCVGCPQVSEKVLSQKGVIDALQLKKEIFSFPSVILSAPSNFIVNNAVRAGMVPKQRSRVIRNVYVPTEDFDCSLKSKEKSILLIADSFDEQRKGLALSVDSLKKASEYLDFENESVTLHLVGGLDTEVVKRLNGTGLNVVTHGHIKEHKKLVEIFQQCHFILSCSYEDNWPNILVESGSYGCIPVVGKWHGCEEFALEFAYGFVSLDYTVTAFCKAILDALSYGINKHELQSFVKAVRESSSVEKVAQGYLESFNFSGTDLFNETEKVNKIEFVSNEEKVKYTPSPFGPRLIMSQDISRKDLLLKGNHDDHSYGIVDTRWRYSAEFT